ncbi:DUF5011 domain-containing protein [Candidatus Woesearchaeota archaeon]|nr:DUF5011 domain-containing protein [Candidatus Woesearchaeota archaeon]
MKKVFSLVLMSLALFVMLSCEKDEVLKPDEVQEVIEIVEQVIKSDLFVYHIMGGVDTLSTEKKELKGEALKIKSIKKVKNKDKDKNLFLFEYPEKTDSIYIDNAVNEFDTMTYATSIDSGAVVLRMNYALIDKPVDTTDTVEPVDTVVEVDKVAPVLTLNGETSVTVIRNRTYTELGATAIDNVDGDISNKVVITGDVNTGSDGAYYVYYTVKDEAGNVSEKTRTVLVVKPEVTYTYENTYETITDTVINQNDVDYDYPGLNGALMNMDDVPNGSVWLAAIKYEDGKYSIFRYTFSTSTSDTRGAWRINATHDLKEYMDVTYENDDTYAVDSYVESNEIQDWINDTLCNVITHNVTYETITVTRYTSIVVNSVADSKWPFYSESTGGYENPNMTSHDIYLLGTMNGTFEIVSNTPDRNIMKVDMNYRTDKENIADFGEVIFLREDYVLNVMGDGSKTADEILIPYLLYNELESEYLDFDYLRFYNSQK